jgi:hypothetical protein
MLKRKVLLPLVAALGFAAVPAMSAVTEYYEVQTAPPVVVVETVPAPQAEMTWVPGYYDYSNGQYYWVAGRYMPVREGYVYVAPKYEDGRYYTGRWAKADVEEHGGTRNKIRQAKNKVKDRVKYGDKD